MKTLILGATGYTGMLLMRLLSAHPEIGRVYAASSTRDGKAVSEVDPGLAPHLHERIEPVYLSLEEAQSMSFDVVFSALPHGASAEIWAPHIGKSVIIDLSADFRFADGDRYTAAYGIAPPLPEFQGRSIYGLVEWYREQIPSFDIIANPGCYPTATLLPLLPMVEDIRGTVVVNALSGISGAGKKEKTNLLFAERSENGGAYSPGTTHRHEAEIREQILLNVDSVERSRLGAPPVLFNPHLVPIKQGMVVTTTVTVEDPEKTEIRIRTRYAKEPFVHLLDSGAPESRYVRGTNRIDIAFHREENHLILLSTIDNLWKGASGQAVQNMNVRFGIPETTGLLYPGDL